MKPTRCPTPEMLARRLRDLLDAGSEHTSERRTRLLMQMVLRAALSGHVGFLLWVINAADGPRHPTAEEETICEVDCVIADEGQDAKSAKAA